MIQSFYDQMGLGGAIFASLLVFLLFILWLAGIAGITLPVDGGKQRKNKAQIVLAIIFPLYPIIWVIYELIRHRLTLEKERKNLLVR